jgi:hypothetical protein
MAATKKRADTKKRSQDKAEQIEMGSVSAIDLLEEDYQQVDGFFDEYETFEDTGEGEAGAKNLSGIDGPYADRGRDLLSRCT